MNGETKAVIDWEQSLEQIAVVRLEPPLEVFLEGALEAQREVVLETLGETCAFLFYYLSYVWEIANVLTR